MCRNSFGKTGITPERMGCYVRILMHGLKGDRTDLGRYFCTASYVGAVCIDFTGFISGMGEWRYGRT